MCGLGQGEGMRMHSLGDQGRVAGTIGPPIHEIAPVCGDRPTPTNDDATPLSTAHIDRNFRPPERPRRSRESHNKAGGIAS